MTFWKWSKTAATNATVDASINYAEGMAPSGLNDSGRAVMAAAAKYRDDISGAIATSGTSTAYTVASNQVFDSLAHLDGAMIAFTPHATNGATVTLNVDSLGAKPLRSAPSTELPAGVLIQGTPYLALYKNSDAAFYLHGFFGNPYNIPIGSGLDYWGTTAPNSAFVFPYGQAISRTTYSTLFGLFGTLYGTGDGSTTFTLPDCRGRMTAKKDDMGGTAASRLTSPVAGGTLGAAGGKENQPIGQANLPNVNLSASNLTASVTNGSQVLHSNLASGFPAQGGGTTVLRPSDVAQSDISVTIGGNVPLGGSGTALTTVPPVIVCNYIIRII